MQNSVNHRDFERIWHFQVSLGSMFLRVEFPTHLGACSHAAGAGLWGALGCAPLAEVGECGACSGRACGSHRARVPGVCLQMGPLGLIGVLVASPRSANGRWCFLAHTSGHHRRSLLRARLASEPAADLRIGGRRRWARARLSGRSLRRITEPPPSNGARLPAELKHITKRRKRNQQGCP